MTVMSFVSEFLLVLIFWKLSEKDENRRHNGSTNNDIDDEEAEVQERTWMMFMKTDDF